MQQKTAAARARLSEIFTSIEGEGILFGTKTMFVRLAGCPLKCHWCDTPYALPLDSGYDYSVDEVKDLISKSLQPNTYKVNFTGGEPLVQHGVVIELAKFVREKGIKTYLESSCYDPVRFAKVLPHIDIVKIEFKLRDSGAVDEKHYNSLLKSEFDCLRMAIASGKTTYIKVVVTNRSNLKEFKKLVHQVFKVVDKPGGIAGFIIQPSNRIDEPSLDVLFGFYDAVYPLYDQVRIVPQLHKIIGIR
ncbi:MAG TPA: 7-carboxy-7-deazaguanine synthase QueE [Nitrososphaera sp.]|nr:7-carboxy-7-deazaguanine synthase QueE [Nitrososphaera sp.]